MHPVRLRFLFLALGLGLTAVVHAQPEPQALPAPLPPPQIRIDRIPADRVNSGNAAAIIHDRQGFLWIGAQQTGLHWFDPETCKTVSYPHDPAKPHSLSNGLLMSLHADRQGGIWASMRGGGLNRLDKKTGTFSYLTVRNSGLPDDGVFGLLCDKDVWMSTDNGVARYTPETRVWKHYTTDDGLQGRVFYNPSYYRSPFTGELFFGGPNGINSFFRSRSAATPRRRRWC